MTLINKIVSVCLGGVFALAALNLPSIAQEGAYVLVTESRIGVNKFFESGRTGIEKAAATHGVRALIFESTDPSTRR